MNLERFVRERESQWAELEQLVAHARRKPERLGAAGVRRLGALYRGAAADLALARRRFPLDPTVVRLEQLVGRARHLVYDAPVREGSRFELLSRGYWRRVAERPALLGIAAVLFFAPLALTATWALTDPGSAGELVPAQYRAVAEPREGGEALGISADEQAALSSAIFTNNIRVAFLAFAGGITAGLLTGTLLAINGAFIGLLAGLAFEAGNGPPFVELVVAHGVLEVSCIVVAGLAGLRLGWAVVDPGRRARGAAVRAEARAGVELALGSALWLVVAGLVEGFVTPAGTGLATAIAVGAGLGGVFWALVLWRGRPAAPSPDPAALARQSLALPLARR